MKHVYTVETYFGLYIHFPFQIVLDFDKNNSRVGLIENVK